MRDLRELYQETILDHSKKPRNFREMPKPDRVSVGNNPLCGDRLTLYLRLEGDRIADVSFVGQGCAISKASASMMTDAVRGKSRSEAEILFRDFHGMVTTEPGTPADSTGLGKLVAFAGVSEFPIRVKCATLPWHTLLAAMRGEAATTTET